jgi:parallel beta-helix repeat protein
VADGNGLGMQVNGFQVAVTGNTLEHNRQGGVFLFTTDSSFTNNKVRDNGIIGVFVLAQLLFADGGSVDGSNMLQGNTVQDNAGDGIRIQSDGNTVDDNALKGNRGDGVQLTGNGPILNTVTANTVTGNGHDGIDNSADATLISDNHCKDNGGADLAGIGDSTGTVAKGSMGNVVGDDSGLTSTQELEMETLE